MATCDQAILVYLCKNGPTTVEKLSQDLAYWDYSTITKALQGLHNDRRVYISRWVQKIGAPIGDYAPAYKAGLAKDVQLPSSERAQRVSKSYWTKFKPSAQALGVWRGLA